MLVVEYSVNLPFFASLVKQYVNEDNGYSNLLLVSIEYCTTHNLPLLVSSLMNVQ